MRPVNRYRGQCAVYLDEIADHYGVDEQEEGVPSNGDPQRLLAVILKENTQRHTGHGVHTEVEKIRLEIGHSEKDKRAVTAEVTPIVIEAIRAAATER